MGMENKSQTTSQRWSAHLPRRDLGAMLTLFVLSVAVAGGLALLLSENYQPIYWSSTTRYYLAWENSDDGWDFWYWLENKGA